MENRIYGIVTIGIAILLYYLAYNNYRKEKYHMCISYIMLGGLLLRIFTSMDCYLHEWDERFHALVAKNLLQNPFKPMLYSNPILEYDYKNWAGNHIWVHKQPFPLYSMALSMLAFGKSTIALRIPSILLSTISILATYKIGNILASKKIGLLAAFLFSINGLIIESTAGRVATDHIDVFFYSLVTISIYFLLRSVERKSVVSLVLGAVITGLAILSKWLPALIVLPIWLIYSWQKQDAKTIVKNLMLFMVITLAVVLPWQLYILKTFPLEAAWEYQYNKKHIFEALGPHGKPFYYHFDRMRIIFGELVYLPLIWLIVNAYKRLFNRDYSKLIILIWILIPYLFFSFATTKMQGYILLCSSAIFIMISLFFFEIKSCMIKYNIALNLILMLLILLPIRYSIERIKPFSIEDRSRSWISEMKQIDTEDVNMAVVFNCRFPIKTMFHTNLIAYESIPDIGKLKNIKSEGYKIYIDNHKAINDQLSTLEFVEYIEITGDSNN